MTVAVPTAWYSLTTDEQRQYVLAQQRELGQVIADKDAAHAVAAMNTHFDTSITDLSARYSAAI